MVDAVDFYGGDGSREEFGEEFGRNDEEMDYKQLKANHEAAGYREGLGKGEEFFLQEGFNRGFAHCSRLNSCWSQVRGVLCAFMQYLQLRKWSLNPEQKENLLVQIRQLLSELDEQQRVEVKEMLAVEETRQVCSDKAFLGDTVKECCTGQCGQELQGSCTGNSKPHAMQGHCAKESDQEMTQRHPVDTCQEQRSHQYCGKQKPVCTCTGPEEYKSFQDTLHHREQQNVVTDGLSDESPCQPGIKNSLTSRMTRNPPSPNLTEIWLKCSSIAQQLGLGDSDLDEIRKCFRTISC